MTLPEPDKLFGRFADDAGTEAAARANFQLLVTDLVKVRFPDASTVEGSGGRDWGIDTYVGQLAGGDVRIWQSKFIRKWDDKVPQNSVRTSFKSARTNAEQKKYKLSAWTLVTPCLLAPDQQKWFDRWASNQLRDYGIVVTLWNGTELRHQLMNHDAADVARSCFPHLFPAPASAPVPRSAKVAKLANPADYEGALFVRQLREAGRVETDAATAHFFATEALVRDYADKGQADAVDAMSDLHLDVHEIWENRYNKQFRFATSDGRIPDLIDEVIEQAAQCDDPPGLALAKAHKKGTAHRLVEQKQAGWVTQWRQIAAEHAATSKAGLVTAPISAEDAPEVDTAGAEAPPAENVEVS